MATDFRDLRVWEEAMVLVESVYEVSAAFPGAERFGLTAQIRRAAVSVPSTIAEGNGRSSRREYLHFLSIAKGSLSEVQTQLLLAVRLGFVSEAGVELALERARSVSFLLQSLRKALISKASGNGHSPFPIPHSRL